jgi:hypothetical protein
MSTTDYLINAALILVVLLQIRERRLGLRTILLPVVIVAFAAQNYLHSIPTSGNDVLLIAVLIALGATLGAFAGLFMQMRRSDDGGTLARAGWLAAGLWIVGIGARLAFVLASEHGAGHAIAQFSIDHQITGAAAWTAALVLMAFAEVFARLAVIQIRSLRLARSENPTSVAVAGA